MCHIINVFDSASSQQTSKPFITSMSPNTMTGGSAPITQNTANTLLGTCWEHRVSASYVFLLACISRYNFFLHSTLLLILGIRLNKCSIDITSKRVLMLSKRALRSLRPHPPSAMCCKQNSVTSAAYFVSRPPSYTQYYLLCYYMSNYLSGVCEMTGEGREGKNYDREGNVTYYS